MMQRLVFAVLGVLVACGGPPTDPTDPPETISTSWVGIAVDHNGVDGAFVRADLNEVVGQNAANSTTWLHFWTGEQFEVSTTTQPNRKWTASSALWWAGRGPIEPDVNGGIYHSKFDERFGLITMFPRSATLRAYCGSLTGTDASGSAMTGRIGVLRRGDELRGVYYGASTFHDHHWGYFTSTASADGAAIVIEEFPAVGSGSLIRESGGSLNGTVNWVAGGQADFAATPCVIPSAILQ